jgi:AcrR family transcriptional regulator
MFQIRNTEYAMHESRRERERKARRALILEAAESVFGRKPFDEASMQEVAAEAQIGMQGLYEQFPSKQSLYEGLILDRSNEFQQKASEALSGIRDPLERLEAWALIMAGTFERVPAFLPVFLREKTHHDWGLSSRVGPATCAIFSKEERRLRGLMGAAVRSGALAKLDPNYLAHFFFGTLMASLHHHFRRGPGEEVQACVGRAMECFLAGVGERP